MDVRDLYANKHLFEQFAFEYLLYDDMMLVPKMGLPEIIPDVVIENLVAYHYFGLTAFDKGGTPAMGEIGGICLGHDDLDERILAIDPFSAHCVAYALTYLMQSGESMEEACDTIKEKIGYQPERKGNIIRVDGTQRSHHYDFRTILKPEGVMEYLWPDRVAMWRAAGRKMNETTRQLSNEFYNFMIPYSKPVIEALRNIDIRNARDCVDAVSSQHEHIIPKGFVAGFHMLYTPRDLIMRPVLSKTCWNENKDFLPEEKFESEINLIGIIAPGNNINVWNENILTSNWLEKKLN